MMYHCNHWLCWQYLLAWLWYSPKQASLISVLSVLCIIFTTNITANGVRNEIACQEKKRTQYPFAASYFTKLAWWGGGKSSFSIKKHVMGLTKSKVFSATSLCERLHILRFFLPCVKHVKAPTQRLSTSTLSEDSRYCFLNNKIKTTPEKVF